MKDFKEHHDKKKHKFKKDIKELEDEVDDLKKKLSDSSKYEEENMKAFFF